jgi:hypothetical protein
VEDSFGLLAILDLPPRSIVNKSKWNNFYNTLGGAGSLQEITMLSILTPIYGNTGNLTGINYLI